MRRDFFGLSLVRHACWQEHSLTTALLLSSVFDNGTACRLPFLALDVAHARDRKLSEFENAPEPPGRTIQHYIYVDPLDQLRSVTREVNLSLVGR